MPDGNAIDGRSMRRVKKHKRCPVCGKPDWCLYSDDGRAAICARISEGSVKRCGDAGWLHIFQSNEKLKYYAQNTILAVESSSGNSSAVAFSKLAGLFQKRLTDSLLQRLSSSIGVSAESLKRLGTGFDGRTYTFPMFNENRKIIGIRRRFLNGKKIAVKGSKNGLFIPEGLGKFGKLFICEGPTDTAAALDLGFDAIGRPNCDSRIEMTAKFAQGRSVTIIADNDTPGIEGAKKLSKRLRLCCPAVKIIVPPDSIKDLRQWKNAAIITRIV